MPGANVVVSVPVCEVTLFHAPKSYTANIRRKLITSLRGFAGCDVPGLPRCIATLPAMKPSSIVSEITVTLLYTDMVTNVSGEVPVTSITPESFEAHERLKQNLTWYYMNADFDAIARLALLTAQLSAYDFPINKITLMAPPTFRCDVEKRALKIPESPPPSMPPPSSPPPPPAPPSPPPGICSDACTLGREGVCNDGGKSDPNPGLKLCPFGTDCTDCGVRTYCSSCPAECQAANLALLKLGSSQHALGCDTDKYGDGICDPECNTRECAYDNGDCSAAQIESKCRTDMATSSSDYTSNPACYSAARMQMKVADISCDLLVPMELQYSVDSPLRLTHNMELNEVVLLQESSPPRHHPVSLARNPVSLARKLCALAHISTPAVRCAGVLIPATVGG